MVLSPDWMTFNYQYNQTGKKSFGKSINVIHFKGNELLGIVVGPRSICVPSMRRQLMELREPYVF